MSETLAYKTHADLARDTARLVPHLLEADAVIGVPRSGMFPASILATTLHVPLGMVGSAAMGAGARTSAPDKIRRVVIVDDSVHTGDAMRDAAAWVQDELGAEYVRACVYLSPGPPDRVDLAALEVPMPRIFAWNLFNSEIIKGALLDIDGVLCLDPPYPEDDTEAYEAYIANATPLNLPAVPVSGLVTNRLEQYREVTMAWMERHRVRHGSLAMQPFTSADARRRMSSPVEFKAAVYADHDATLLIESHDVIAQGVFALTAKPVLSLQSQKVFQ